MPHIHQETGQHDFSVSAYIVRMDLPEPAIIFHLHRKLNKYIQFGGHVELNETPWNATLREVREEAGYEGAQLMLLQPNYNRLEFMRNVPLHPLPVAIHTYPAGKDHYHTDISYAFTTNELPILEVDESERTSTKLLTRNDVATLTKEDIYKNVQDIAIYTLDVAVKEWDVVDLSDYSLGTN
jgi:8-oxo-dGTP pyrophosphatase MutT (NUDIX family)